jgi:hypothetical protein
MWISNKGLSSIFLPDRSSQGWFFEVSVPIGNILCDIPKKSSIGIPVL